MSRLTGRVEKLEQAQGTGSRCPPQQIQMVDVYQGEEPPPVPPCPECGGHHTTDEVS
jgi:hypothetical protein